MGRVKRYQILQVLVQLLSLFTEVIIYSFFTLLEVVFDVGDKLTEAVHMP